MEAQEMKKKKEQGVRAPSVPKHQLDVKQWGNLAPSVPRQEKKIAEMKKEGHRLQ